jgi:hypothetical protein
MLAICEHCGHRNEVPDAALNTEVLCGQCRQLFFAVSAEEQAANRRAMKLLSGAVLIFLALLALLIFSRSKSGGVDIARRALVGSSIAGRLGGGFGQGNGSGDSNGNGNGNGTGSSGNGSGTASTSGGNGRGGGEKGLPDPLATGGERPDQRSIGRLPRTLGQRKAGDDVRAGAAGTDEPTPSIGNSPRGEITNAPSAGANPGNSDRRNSIETPEGDERLTGLGSGAEGSALGSTNSRNNALLLDDFSERLRQAGARSGDVQVSLEWKNVNDLDLHVIDPSGERIFYSHPRSTSGGVLDVDMNRSGNDLTTRPVENVYWPEHAAPRGTYRVEVMHFANHGGQDPTLFTVRVINKGQSSFYRGYINFIATADRAHVVVCTFTVQ